LLGARGKTLLHCAEDRALVGKAVVENANRGVRLLNDLRDGRLLVSLFGKELLGSIEQAFKRGQAARLQWWAEGAVCGNKSGRHEHLLQISQESAKGLDSPYALIRI